MERRLPNPYAAHLRQHVDDRMFKGTFVAAGVGSGDSIQLIREGVDRWTIAVHNDLAGSEAVSYVDQQSLRDLVALINGSLAKAYDDS